MKRIEEIKLVQAVDENPDTSCLGEYTNTLSKFVIVRQFDEYYCNLTDEQRGSLWHSDKEYQYFIPYARGETPGSSKYFEYGRQDHERMEGLCNNSWCYLNLSAEATITIDGTYQHVRSGSVGGVESDSGQDYIQEILSLQKEELRKQLRAMGFRCRLHKILLRG